MVRATERVRDMYRTAVMKETTREYAAIAGALGGLAVAALVVDFCITCVMF